MLLVVGVIVLLRGKSDNSERVKKKNIRKDLRKVLNLGRNEFLKLGGESFKKLFSLLILEVVVRIALEFLKKNGKTKSLIVRRNVKISKEYS